MQGAKHKQNCQQSRRERDDEIDNAHVRDEAKGHATTAKRRRTPMRPRPRQWTWPSASLRHKNMSATPPTRTNVSEGRNAPDATACAHPWFCEYRLGSQRLLRPHICSKTPAVKSCMPSCGRQSSSHPHGSNAQARAVPTPRFQSTSWHRSMRRNASTRSTYMQTAPRR